MNWKISVIVALFMSTFCSARDVQETFLQANSFYNNKEYKKAYDLYNTISRKGCSTWYNMGNCAFKMNKHVDSLVCWRKAQHNATARELQNIEKNINTVYQVLGRTPEHIGFNHFVRTMLNRFSLFFWQILFLLFWFIFFIVVFLVKRYRRLMLLLLLPLNIVFGSAVVKKYRLQRYPRAIVVAKSSIAFTGPDVNYHHVGSIDIADEVTVLQQRDGWYKVQAKRFVGWVTADTIEVI